MDFCSLAPKEGESAGIGTPELGWCTCCNRALIRRSSGSERRAVSPKRRDGACSWRAHRSPKTERGRSLFEHRSSEVGGTRWIRIWGVPKIRALNEATYFAGLRKAGKPEE